MIAVIMAGGSGTRFWPTSRKEKPKQFMNICGKDAMVVETANRLKPIAADEEMILVVGREHLDETERLFNGRKVHLLAEPVGRNTAPCIGLGAIYTRYLGHEGPIAFLPADHFIRDSSAFVDDLRLAGEVAESGAIVTLGIVPTRPETGYGYIRRGDEVAEQGRKDVYQVSAFVEKPDLKTAEKYLSKGNYFWNAGIFVATPETILKEIQQYLQDLYRGLMLLETSLGSPSFESELEKVYRDLEGISFDYGIMERTENPVYVLPCDCGWSDVGSWESLYELRETELDKDLNYSEGTTMLFDCEGSFVSSKGDRLVACLGLKKCLVVDTPDALLVADIEKSQDIRKIVEEIKKRGKDELL